MKNVEFFSSTNLSVPDEGYERYRLMDALPVLSDPLQVETLWLMVLAPFQTPSLIKKTETLPKNTSQASPSHQEQE